MSTVSDVDAPKIKCVPTSYRGKMSMTSMTPMRMPLAVTCLETQVSLFSFLFLYFTNNYLLRTLQLTTVTSTIARCSSKERPTTPALEGGDWGMGAGDSSGSRCVSSVASRLSSPKYLYILSIFYFIIHFLVCEIILLNLDFNLK